MALNLREGDGLREAIGGFGTWSALASLNEAEAALQISVALGYVESVDDTVTARFRHVRAVLVKLTRTP